MDDRIIELLYRNLQEVFGEGDAARRRAALIESAISPLSSAAKSRVAAHGDQCVRGPALCRLATSAIAKSATRPMPEDVLNGPRFGADIKFFVGLPAQFIIDAGKHLQGPGDVQHLAVWKCQH